MSKKTLEFGIRRASGWKAGREDLAPYGRTVAPFPPEEIYEKELLAPLKDANPEYYAWFIGCAYQIPDHYDDGKNVSPSQARSWSGDDIIGLPIHDNHGYRRKLGGVMSFWYDTRNDALWIGALLRKKTPHQRAVIDMLTNGRVRGLSIGFLNVGGRGPLSDNKPFEISVTGDPDFRQCMTVEVHTATPMAAQNTNGSEGSEVSMLVLDVPNSEGGDNVEFDARSSAPMDIDSTTGYSPIQLVLASFSFCLFFSLKKKRS